VSERRSSILGVGYAVPNEVRTNSDPIFDWLKANAPNGTGLFQGYRDRRVLPEGRDLMAIMLPAAEDAIGRAGIEKSDVDLVLGTGSVSRYGTPNDLCKLHKELGLDPRAWVLPLANDFTNFNAGLVLADAMIRAGRIRHALVCVGGDWTRNVSYHTPQAVSAADGAGAVVVGPPTPSGWSVVDSWTETDSSFYGSMYTAADPVECPNVSAFGQPYFHITAQGIQGFKTFGTDAPPRAALGVLGRHGIHPRDVCLISHQASSVLLQAWSETVGPGQYLNTLEEYANMAVANIPVTFAWAALGNRIQRDHLVLLGVGPDMHTNAVLLSRRHEHST
jgi:3-oxoacyl-[acyl-carrier-protein] synthase III